MLKAFETGLAKLSLRDGGTVQLIRHTSDGDPARLARQAEEVVRQKSDVIFAGFTPAVIALKRHTTSIPVVFAG
jgi:putative ABC transport system substrate-binding protein